MTLNRIGVDDFLIRPNDMMVHAFDETKTEIDLKILIGPCEFELSFVAVDISAVFNLLLRRPWLHFAGAISSNLHQKVKFISGNNLITVMAEEDIPVPTSIMVPFIDTQQIDSTSKRRSLSSSQ